VELVAPDGRPHGSNRSGWCPRPHGVASVPAWCWRSCRVRDARWSCSRSCSAVAPRPARRRSTPAGLV